MCFFIIFLLGIDFEEILSPSLAINHGVFHGNVTIFSPYLRNGIQSFCFEHRSWHEPSRFCLRGPFSSFKVQANFFIYNATINTQMTDNFFFFFGKMLSNIVIGSIIGNNVVQHHLLCSRTYDATKRACLRHCF